MVVLERGRWVAGDEFDHDFPLGSSHTRIFDTAFRRADPGDRALVEPTAWASLTAARRVGALRDSTR